MAAIAASPVCAVDYLPARMANSSTRTAAARGCVCASLNGANNPSNNDRAHMLKAEKGKSSSSDVVRACTPAQALEVQVPRQPIAADQNLKKLMPS